MAAEPKYANPLAALIGYQLRRASAALMVGLSRDLEPLGLRPIEASVLLMIDANPRITQSEIGRILAIQSANMAPLVGSFIKAGLVRRERVDGRSYSLVTTTEGAALATRAKAIMIHQDEHLSEALPAELRDRLAAVLAAIW